MMRALILDMDGTLIDSVYAQVLAWQRSFEKEGMHVPAWSIHSKIGLGGQDLAKIVGSELGTSISGIQAQRFDKRHNAIMKELLSHPIALPGATELLRHLRAMRVPWGIATSGDRAGVKEALRSLDFSDKVTFVCKEDVKHAKPHPDLFLACRARLKIPAQDCFVVGDAVWDMLAAKRSGMLGVGLLTGGTSRSALTEAGAYRVYNDAAELDAKRHELGFVI
jgi:HAD superfamily hydrolase (TIGR01509 family)